MDTGLRKMLRKYVEVLFLDELRKHSIHGYGFIELIKNKYGFKPSPSMIYPVLRTLEKMGLVEATEVYTGSRKSIVYKITEAGIKYLEDNTELLQQARKHEKKIILARKAGLFNLLRTAKVLFERIDQLSEEELERIRRAAENFMREVEDLKG
ncbi:MAG: PadR family transcriptional regulator [Desulfurococcales archaeon]|nr:PadR family transcriptional regulator [Desulfurococcales archaeon]